MKAFDGRGFINNGSTAYVQSSHEPSASLIKKVAIGL